MKKQTKLETEVSSTENESHWFPGRLHLPASFYFQSLRKETLPSKHEVLFQLSEMFTPLPWYLQFIFNIVRGLAYITSGMRKGDAFPVRINATDTEGSLLQYLSRSVRVLIGPLQIFALQ